MRGDRKYANLVEIYDELEYAAQIHRRLGCPVLEVSDSRSRRSRIGSSGSSSSGGPGPTAG